MLFADASALIAIIGEEADGLTFADAIDNDPLRLCSPISAWETVARLSNSFALPIVSSRARVRLFLAAMNFEFVSIGQREFEIAGDAYARFGKGRHPAALNMGDCFAYACARANEAKLLFKGDDFRRTDIASAL